MTKALQQALLEVQKLPDDMQDFIAAIIMDALANLHIPQSHKDELDRRVESSEVDPNAVSPWLEVKARLS